MKLDHFKNLTEDEQAKYLEGCESLETTIKDNEAEISSLRSENETLKSGTTKLEEDLKKTKELNFTLGRQIDTSKNQASFEDTLHDCFGYKERSNIS